MDSAGEEPRRCKRGISGVRCLAEARAFWTGTVETETGGAGELPPLPPLFVLVPAEGRRVWVLLALLALAKKGAKD